LTHFHASPCIILFFFYKLQITQIYKNVYLQINPIILGKRNSYIELTTGWITGTFLLYFQQEYMNILFWKRIRTILGPKQLLVYWVPGRFPRD